MSKQKISLQDWQEQKATNGVLIDVRSPAEFASAHVPGSVNLPLTTCDPDRLRKVLGEMGLPKDVSVCLICHSGTRSGMAAQQLAPWDDGELLLMDCGVGTLNKEQLVIGKKNALPIDRQVRIVAGSMVLIGVACGLLLSPVWFGVSAFVGAGLIFAGVTDVCGMARMLEHMPWNKA